MKMNHQTTQLKKTDSIQFKLLIIPLFCVFIGIVAIGTISSYLIRDSLLEELKNNGFTTSQRFVTQLENNANAVEALTASTSGATLEQREKLAAEFSYQTLIDKMADDETIVYIAIIDKNVIDIADSIKEDIGTDYSDDESMKAAAQEGIASASEYYYESHM